MLGAGPHELAIVSTSCLLGTIQEYFCMVLVDDGRDLCAVCEARQGVGSQQDDKSHRAVAAARGGDGEYK